MTEPEPPDATTPPSGLVTRRAVLAGVPATAALTAAVPGPSAATVQGDDYTAQALKALAAYVVPGNDAYSTQQGLTTAQPGGVAAGTDRMLRHTYDEALAVGVAPALQINAPGALGLALVLELYARARYFWESYSGPYEHGFANLAHAKKAQVLGDLDRDALLAATPIGYAFGTLITMAAFGAYSEYGVYDAASRRLTGRPVGWALAQYDGVSDGWPEFHGYWKGRTAVSDPGSARA
jgi:hypothetical protein